MEFCIEVYMRFHIATHLMLAESALIALHEAV